MEPFIIKAKNGRPTRPAWIVDDETGCWRWDGAVSGNGYGHLRRDGRDYPSHRFIYELAVGEIPAGLELDHLCKQPLCCNPSHLEPVSHRTNILRSSGLSALNAKKTHCKVGHPFDESNTYVASNGSRICRACGAAAGRMRRSRRALAHA